MFLQLSIQTIQMRKKSILRNAISKQIRNKCRIPTSHFIFKTDERKRGATATSVCKFVGSVSLNLCVVRIQLSRAMSLPLSLSPLAFRGSNRIAFGLVYPVRIPGLVGSREGLVVLVMHRKNKVAAGLTTKKRPKRGRELNLYKAHVYILYQVSSSVH